MFSERCRLYLATKQNFVELSSYSIRLHREKEANSVSIGAKYFSFLSSPYMPELQQDTKKGNIMNEEQNDTMSLLKTIYHTRLEPHNCFLK